MQPSFIPPFSVPHLPLILGGLSTFLLCWLIILSSKWHGHLTHDYTNGVQKFHFNPTSRIGGLAILIGLIVGWLSSPSLVDVELKHIFWASLPAFGFGFAEDLTHRISAQIRLIATMLSGVLAFLLTGLSLTRVDIFGFDLLLTWVPLSVIFTAFAIAGIANAINIIDGFHGLASGTVLISLASLGYTSYLVNDIVLAKVCFVLAGIVLGFFLVNYPFGRIFLGDGGAYLLGFWLGWIAVVLVSRNPGVSAWSAVLACAYPITEVVFSIYRRFARGVNPGKADRLHLHSLIKVRLVRKKFPNLSFASQNPIVSLLLWSLAIIPAVLGPVLHNSTAWSVLTFSAFSIIYMKIYFSLVRFSAFNKN